MRECVEDEGSLDEPVERHDPGVRAREPASNLPFHSILPARAGEEVQVIGTQVTRAEHRDERDPGHDPFLERESSDELTILGDEDEARAVHRDVLEPPSS